MTFSWQCPFCDHWAAIDDGHGQLRRQRLNNASRYGPIVVAYLLTICPNPECREIAFELQLTKAANPHVPSNISAYDAPGEAIHSWRLVPASRAKPMPSVVPESIVNDYDEACAIESLSPKASATLARRCVQQIIRGFFGVSRGTLNEEIQAIKGAISGPVWESVDALRQLGNIGAHPEKDINVIIDVDPDEAAALIRLIEILIAETYIARDRQDKELQSVRDIAEAKKQQKVPPPP